VSASSSHDRRDRQRARRYGIWTEILAALALRFKGYKILARNFKTKSGEIDIIARKGDLIAIVEVKARRDLQASVDAVGFQSRQRIQAAANRWLTARRDAHRLSLRFDIIAVQPWSWPRHLEDAF
jgi:putative endonuclease